MPRAESTFTFFPIGASPSPKCHGIAAWFTWSTVPTHRFIVILFRVWWSMDEVNLRIWIHIFAIHVRIVNFVATLPTGPRKYAHFSGMVLSRKFVEKITAHSTASRNRFTHFDFRKIVDISCFEEVNVFFQSSGGFPNLHVLPEGRSSGSSLVSMQIQIRI